MKHRKSIRLDGFDYAKYGYYFVTVDTWSKRKLFGEIIDGKMILNENGHILYDEILKTPKMRFGVKIHTFQIMPDNWHAIIFLPNVGTQCIAPYLKKQNLGNIIGGIKMMVSKKLKINGIRLKIWQRNYYERIIRDNGELDGIRKYIIENPEKFINKMADVGAQSIAPYGADGNPPVH